MSFLLLEPWVRVKWLAWERLLTLSGGTGALSGLLIRHRRRSRPTIGRPAAERRRASRMYQPA